MAEKYSREKIVWLATTNVSTILAATTTDDLPEGTTNLYYTDGRVDANSTVVANTNHRTGDGSDHSDVAANTVHSTGDGSDHADVASNTAHRGTTTGNPHQVTFTEAVTADGGTDISAAEAETLTDGSNADSLHAHDHGALAGLNDDDHTQYHTDARAKTWVESGDIDYIYFDTTYATDPTEGQIAWNGTDGTLGVGMPGGNVVLQVGQETLIRARNATGAQIDNGTPVAITGSSGNRPTIEEADADSALDHTYHMVCGVVTEDIAASQNGYITAIGVVREMDTSSWAEGTKLYLAVGGGLTATEPSAPNAKTCVGIVVNQHATEGAIFVHPQNSITIEDLENVNGTTPDATNKHLVWDNGNGYWDAGQIDHGDVAGLTDDDHPQYPKKTGWDIDALADVTMTFTDLTRTFSIAPAGTSFSFWVEGTQYTKSTAQTVVITDTEGVWFITFDNTGTLQASQTPWDIAAETSAFVAVLYWSSTDSTCILIGHELHTWVMDAATHRNKHFTTGSLYGTGFLPGSLDIDGSGNDASAAQMSFTGGTFYDEDIINSVVDDGNQDLSPIAQIPVFYRSGASGDWRKIAATDYPIAVGGTGLAVWNEYTGATWQLTEITTNQYGLIHLIATNDINEPIISIPGQADYTTILAARDAAPTELTNLQQGALENLSPEFIPIATFIIQTSNTYSNAVKTRFRSTDTGDDFIDWRGTSNQGFAGTGGGTPTDHGSLSGLGDDDHTQYHNDTRGDARYSQLGHGHTSSDITDWATTDLAVQSLSSAGNLQLNAGGPDTITWIYFHNAGSDTDVYFGWEDTADTFYVSDDLYIAGDLTVVGTVTLTSGLNPSEIQQDGATDGQVMTWNNGAGTWEPQTNPSAPVTSVNTYTGDVVLDYTDVGAAASSHNHVASDITDWATYNLSVNQVASATSVTATGVVQAANVRSLADVYVNYDGADGDSRLYFYDGSSPTGQSLMWDDTPGEFVLSADLNVSGSVSGTDVFASGDVYVNAGGGDATSYVYFHDGASDTGQYLRWNDTSSRLELSTETLVDGLLRVSGSVAVYGGAVYINYDGPDGDSNLYFYDASTYNTQYLRWDDVPGEFVLSADLNISGDIEATNAVFTDLTATGTITGIGASDVGLGNVVNVKQVEVASSAFTKDFTTGTLTINDIVLFQNVSGAMRYSTLGSLLSDYGSNVKSKTIYIEDPVGTDSYPIGTFPVACTITSVTHITDTGTVTFNLEERASTTPDVAGTDVFTSDLTASSTSSTASTGFANDGMAANAWLYYAATSVASTPGFIWISIQYTED